jgi:hypothetical protein
MVVHSRITQWIEIAINLLRKVPPLASFRLQFVSVMKEA